LPAPFGDDFAAGFRLAGFVPVFFALRFGLVAFFAMIPTCRNLTSSGGIVEMASK
jgi:hypothetical protein